MPEITVTIDELIASLKQIKQSAKILTIEARVVPQLLKTGNPYRNITKLYRANYIMGANYEASVNRQREREDKDTDFVEQERSWGTRINNFLIEHNGEYYLRLQETREKYSSQYFDGEKEIPYKELEPFFPKKKGATNQGIDSEVRYRNLKISNIVSIQYDGVTYSVRA